jgi:hypothetical protein
MNVMLRKTRAFGAVRLVSLNKLNVNVEPQKTRFKMFQFKYYFNFSTLCTHFENLGKIEKRPNK